jgi:hypothetical protein
MRPTNAFLPPVSHRCAAHRLASPERLKKGTAASCHPWQHFAFSRRMGSMQHFHSARGRALGALLSRLSREARTRTQVLRKDVQQVELPRFRHAQWYAHGLRASPAVTRKHGASRRTKRSFNNVSDDILQRRRDGSFRHCDRLRARRRLARDGIAKKTRSADGRLHCLLRMAE